MKNPTKVERDYMSAVASLPCVVDGCGMTWVEIHHIRRFGEKRKHSKIAPLCVNHHRGVDGIHTLGKKEWERRFMTQDAMLLKTYEMLAEREQRRVV